MTPLAPPPDLLSLALLQSTRTYPAVSVLLSTGGDPSAMPAKLASLIDQADARLQSEPVQNSAALVAALRQLAQDTPVDTGAAALALYVAHDTATAVHLPFGVRDRVVIDETFATRDLVHAHARSPRYRVLTVTEQLCRLYEGLGPVLEPVRGGGFPLDLAPRDEPQRRDRSHERDGRRDEQLRRAVGNVDLALSPHLRADPAPVILVGSERRVASLRETSRHRQLITAAVARPADRLTLAELSRLVQPEVHAMLARQRTEALTELEQARGARRYAAGIGEAWPLVVQGRSALLVVEENFAYPARVDPITHTVAPAHDIEAPDVVDDLVDETIEMVLRTRGRVVLVPDGTLTDAGRVSLVLRW